MSNAAVRVIQGPLAVPHRFLPLALVFDGSVVEVRPPMTMIVVLLPFTLIGKGVVGEAPKSVGSNGETVFRLKGERAFEVDVWTFKPSMSATLTPRILVLP